MVLIREDLDHAIQEVHGVPPTRPPHHHPRARDHEPILCDL
jgi:hypothetical protein